jgi:hypothetical protein
MHHAIYLFAAVAALAGAAVRADPPRFDFGPGTGNRPVQPCLVNSLDCLSLAPQPFRPCLALPKACGDHFEVEPVTMVPVRADRRPHPAQKPAAGGR